MHMMKATREQLRRHNRQLVLRAVYGEIANTRADLASVTELSKPTVSDLVDELIGDGLLDEMGFGIASERGGSRPILLRFNPNARRVIGVAINQLHVGGVLTNLNGNVLLRHEASMTSTTFRDVLDLLIEVINGLYAQLQMPLLCLSVGVSGQVDEVRGVVQNAPRLGWQDAELAELLREQYQTTVYVSNSNELAARGQYAFKTAGWSGDPTTVVTLHVSSTIGIGMVYRSGLYCTGSEIGELTDRPGVHPRFEERLGWEAVAARARRIASRLGSEMLSQTDLSYVHIRYAAAMDDPAALKLVEELSSDLAEVFAWIIALVRPQAVSLSGTMAILGDSFLNKTVHKIALHLPELQLRGIDFRADETPHLPALGAAAKAIQLELGLL